MKASQPFYYVYVLQSENDPELFYTGFTENIEDRLRDHNSGQVPHTSKYQPWRLETAIAFRSRKKASKFEQYLKSHSGRLCRKTLLALSRHSQKRRTKAKSGSLSHTYFDGDPVQVYGPGTPEDSPVPPDMTEDGNPGEGFIYPEAGEDAGWTGIAESGPDDEVYRVRRYVVANVEVKVAAERVRYIDANGKLITESLKDYTRKTLAREFASLDDFLRRWSSAEKKQAIIEELANQGVFFDALADEIGRDCDPFDLVCHVAWGMPPLTRRERAEQVKKRNYFIKYGEQARRVLEALLDKYADEGVEQIEETQILTISPFDEFGTPLEIIGAFGGLDQYQQSAGRA